MRWDEGWLSGRSRAAFVRDRQRARRLQPPAPHLGVDAPALRLDHHDARGADSLVGCVPQVGRDDLGTRRRLDVEMQMNRIGDPADVLAAGALGANRDELDLLV